MVICFTRENAAWDALLNAHYAALREQLPPKRFASLRDVQRKWIAYRDAACAFAYDRYAGGTMAGIVGSQCMLQMTARRAIKLGEILDETSR